MDEKKKVKKLVINLEGDEIGQYERFESETPGVTARGRFLLLLDKWKRKRKQ